MSRYRHEVPLDLHTPLSDYDQSVVDMVSGRVPVRAPKPAVCRCNKLECVECWNRGQRFEDYLKAKRLEEI
jgi:hypothetical protein